MHIDTSAKVLTYLAPHVPQVVYVDAAKRQLEVPQGKGNAVTVGSLSEFAAARSRRVAS